MKRFLLSMTALVVMSLACGQYVTPTPLTPTPPAATLTPSLAPSATVAATARAVATEIAKNFVVVRQAVVNVREAPCDAKGDNCGVVVGSVTAGQSVELVGKCNKDGWCQIVDPAGYVFQGCLSIADGQGCEAK